jgi:hypothetical protein
VCLGRPLISVKGKFRPVTLIGSGVDAPVGRGVLAPLAVVAVSLVTVNNIYKHIFI